MFENYFLFETSSWLLTFYIFIYNVACAIFWPTPSEVPLLLYQKLPLPVIILVSGIGKGFGAYLVCKTWDTLDKILKKLHFNLLFWSKSRVEHYIRKKGFVAYLLMQSIPFMPMRSSIYIFSYISQNSKQVAIGAAIGTIFRNLLMLSLVYLGYISMQATFK